MMLVIRVYIVPLWVFPFETHVPFETHGRAFLQTNLSIGLYDSFSVDFVFVFNNNVV